MCSARLSDLSEPTGEIAFSVEHELQHRGIGTKLFERLLLHALGLGYTRLRVTTHPENTAMRALARKYATTLEFQAGETVGMIDLGPEVAERLLKRLANWAPRPAPQAGAVAPGIG
jgi:GNAT superfamily N-acetyltransferase